MLPPSDDDRYHQLVRHFGDLTIAWQQHRETVTRAIGVLSSEILQIRDWMARDEAHRTARQQQLDAVLGRLEQSDRAIRRWQWVRVLIEIIGVALIVAFVIGLLWER